MAASITGCILQRAPLTTAFCHSKAASAGTFRDSCRPQGQYKRDTLYFSCLRYPASFSIPRESTTLTTKDHRRLLLTGALVKFAFGRESYLSLNSFKGIPKRPTTIAGNTAQSSSQYYYCQTRGSDSGVARDSSLLIRDTVYMDLNFMTFHMTVLPHPRARGKSVLPFLLLVQQ
jgi:hypothetical protein